MIRSRSLAPALLVAAMFASALTVAGCHRKPQGNAIDAVDNQLVNGAVVADGNDSLRSSDITVDPARAKGGKTPEKPKTATAAGAGDCLDRYGPTLAYANDWATKLPAELPVHPQAHLTEAAGHDGGCAVRIASFTVPGERAAVLDWYAARARAAGYGADRRDKGGDAMLTGSKGSATYTVIAGAPKNGATPIDLVWAKAD